MAALWLIVLCGVLALVYAVWTIRTVMASDPGSARMQEIAAAIREGAQAYLKRQYTTIGLVGLVIFLILAYFLGWLVAFGFLIGAVLSGATGFIGMNVSVRANVRTAQAAIRSLADGLEARVQIGGHNRAAGCRPRAPRRHALFRLSCRRPHGARIAVIDALVAFGFGASLISIYARGSVAEFSPKGPTSAANVVGKVEAGIPEDDPRNPATIADDAATSSATARAWRPTCLKPTS